MQWASVPSSGLLRFASLVMGLAAALYCGMAQGVACVRTARWETYPPYGVLSPEGRRSGYYAEVVAEALRRMGCGVRFVEMPWARGLRQIATGGIDLMAGAGHTPEREHFAFFSDSINDTPEYLFLRQGVASRMGIRRLSDLRATRLRIGTRNGAYYGDDYARLLHDPAFTARLVMITDRDRAWTMLEAGRLDGMIADQDTVLARFARRNLSPPDRLVPVLRLSGGAAFVMMSRRTVDAEFVRRFNESLQTMRADGTFVRLREQWIPCPADPKTLGCRVPAPP